MAGKQTGVNNSIKEKDHTSASKSTLLKKLGWERNPKVAQVYILADKDQQIWFGFIIWNFK